MIPFSYLKTLPNTYRVSNFNWYIKILASAYNKTLWWYREMGYKLQRFQSFDFYYHTITPPSTLSTLPLLAIWTHCKCRQHKRFFVTNSMINLQFVPSLGLDIITQKMEIGNAHFVNSKCSSVLPVYLHIYMRWDELQRFQLCPYCFCYHHSSCTIQASLWLTYSPNHKCNVHWL